MSLTIGGIAVLIGGSLFIVGLLLGALRLLEIEPDAPDGSAPEEEDRLPEEDEQC